MQNHCGKVMVFAVLAIIACIGWLLRNIAKKQLRKPLISGMAITGHG